MPVAPQSPRVLASDLSQTPGFLRPRCLAGTPSALPVPAMRNISVATRL